MVVCRKIGLLYTARSVLRPSVRSFLVQLLTTSPASSSSFKVRRGRMDEVVARAREARRVPGDVLTFAGSLDSLSRVSSTR